MKILENLMHAFYGCVCEHFYYRFMFSKSQSILSSKKVTDRVKVNSH